MPTVQEQKTQAPDIRKVEMAEQSHAASKEAAQSVADAVKRVADAAVAEIQKAPASETLGEFTFRGNPGGRFEARSNTLFGSGGSIFLNGKQLHTRAWGAMIIEGDLPADAKPGEVLVDCGGGHTVKGYYRG